MQKKKRVAEAGIRQKYVGTRTRQEGDERGTREQAKQRGTRRARSTPQHIIACQGAVVKVNIPRGGIWGWERIGWGKRCERSGGSDGAREGK